MFLVFSWPEVMKTIPSFMAPCWILLGQMEPVSPSFGSPVQSCSPVGEWRKHLSASSLSFYFCNSIIFCSVHDWRCNICKARLSSHSSVMVGRWGPLGELGELRRSGRTLTLEMDQTSLSSANTDRQIRLNQSRDYSTDGLFRWTEICLILQFSFNHMQINIKGNKLSFQIRK